VNEQSAFVISKYFISAMAASSVELNVALLINEQGGSMDLVNFPALYRGRFGEKMPVPAGMRLKGALQLLERRGIVRVDDRPTANGGTAAWVSLGPAAALVLHPSAPLQYQGRSVQQFGQQPVQPLPPAPQRVQLPVQQAITAQEVTMSAAFLNVFTGDDLKNLNHFRKKYGVAVDVVSQRGALQGRVKVSGDEFAVQIAVSEIREAAAGDPQSYLEKMHFELGTRTCAYVDWSNVYLGARNGDPDPSRLRINVRNLCDRIFAQRELRSLVVAGSAQNDVQAATLTAMWSGVGGECTPSIKFQVRAPGAREQGVDDMLIASALGQIAGNYGGVQQTLVLVTGDGNSNGGGSWVRLLTHSVMYNCASASLSTHHCPCRNIILTLY
jgi:hypothetical protein